MEGLIQILTTFVLLGFIDLHLTDATGQNTEESYFFFQQSDHPKDCYDILSSCDSARTVKNGVFYIKPEGLQNPVEVYCDHDDGGWTVIQRREDGTIDFHRNSTYYKNGFGFPHKEFWMGNELIAFLTNQRKYQLKIDITDKRDREYTGTYNWFRISDEKSGFKLVRVEGFTGSRGITDKMGRQVNGIFYGSEDDCSGNSGWWFTTDCAGPNLNGVYTANDATKLKWAVLNIKKTVMKVRPQPVA